MSFTPEQKLKIYQKENSLPAALRRDMLTNYREGYFFVTINTRDKIPVLCTIVGRPDAPAESAEAPRCLHSRLGDNVIACWYNIPHFHPTVEILDCEVMPDHFHGLLRLHAEGHTHLGIIIRGFMIGCTHAYWDSLGIAWRKSPGVITHDYRDRNHTRSFRGPALFVRGYNDVEVISAEQVENKIRYIHEQARRAVIKQHTPSCFLIHRCCSAHGWTTEALQRALQQDRFLATDAVRCQKALEKINQRIFPHNENRKPTLSYIGNCNLLRVPHKLPLVCHRADASHFEKQKNAIMQAAQKGCIIVSAFISPREREIKKELLAKGFPVIEVTDNGFPDRYKPTGKAFYACAENRLLQISPWTYEYSRHTEVTREMCLVMNELARVITNSKDYWWKNTTQKRGEGG